MKQHIKVTPKDMLEMRRNFQVLAEIVQGLNSGEVMVAGDDGTMEATELSHDGLTGVSPADHHSRYTDEEAQDAVGTICGTGLTYDDAAPSIVVAPGELTHNNLGTYQGSADGYHLSSTDHADLTAATAQLAALQTGGNPTFNRGDFTSGASLPINNLSGTTGDVDGEARLDDGTNTPHRATMCVWDDVNSVWVDQTDGSTFT